MIKAGIKIIKKPGFHSVSQNLEKQSPEAKLSWITRKSGLLKTKYKEIRGDSRLLHRTLLYMLLYCHSRHLLQGFCHPGRCLEHVNKHTRNWVVNFPLAEISIRHGMSWVIKWGMSEMHSVWFSAVFHVAEWKAGRADNYTNAKPLSVTCRPTQSYRNGRCIEFTLRISFVIYQGFEGWVCALGSYIMKYLRQPFACI